MARIIATISATLALLASVQAQQPACPPNGQFCGSELLNVYKCTNETWLDFVTPPDHDGSNIRTWIYPTDSSGTPQIPFADCHLHGCGNAGPNGVPPAHCFS